MKKSVFAILLAVCVSAGLAGCGTLNAPGDERQQVTIYLRNYASHLGVFSEDEPDADFDSMTRYLADRFVEQYDKYDVTIVTEYFQLYDEPKYVGDKYGQPDATDLVLQDAFVNLGHLWEGRLLPLDDIITDEMRRDVDDTLWQSCQAEGHTYMLPFGYLPTPLSYNRQMFRDAGLEAYLPPEDEIADWTVAEWDEITAALRESLPETSAVLPMFGLSEGGDMINMMLLRMFGNPFFGEDGDTCVNDADGVRALRWMADNQEKGYYPIGAENIDAEDNYALFRNGQLAFYMGNNILKASNDKLGLDTGFAYYPAVDGGNIFNFIYTFAAFDNGDPVRAEVAKDFLKFISTDPGCGDVFPHWGALPASNTTYVVHMDDIYMAHAWLDCRSRVWISPICPPTIPASEPCFTRRSRS